MNGRLTAVVSAAMVLLMLAGCGSSEDDPTGPDTNTHGTVVIDAEPDALDAPWDLTGPESYSGSGEGDSTLTDMTPGDYTITWGTVSGWIVPASEEKSLTSGGTVTFSGTYTEQGSIQPEFVLIPSGSFTMGTPLEELGAFTDEHPQHTVVLTRAFHMQNVEVTNQQYIELAQWAVDQGYASATDATVTDALDGSTEELLDLDAASCEIVFSDGAFGLKDFGGETRPNRPVQNITWYGTVAYCDWLSLQGGLLRAHDHATWECNGNDPYGAQGYRLPTEAEWEYACRAGTSTAFANGDIIERFCGFDPVLDQIGWYCGNSSGASHPFGEKIPNAWGLYDMHGNIWEWCNDWYRDDYYTACGSSITDPVGPTTGYTRRVLRGGNFQHGAEVCRSGDRNSYQPSIRDRYIGFRPVRTYQ